MTFKINLAVIGLIISIPVLLCFIFKYYSQISIGPYVLGYSILSLPVLTWLCYRNLTKRIDGRVAMIVAIAIGAVLSVLVLNYFMEITHYFGIKDYEAM